jgi:hypothetical protein
LRALQLRISRWREDLNLNLTFYLDLKKVVLSLGTALWGQVELVISLVNDFREW